MNKNKSKVARLSQKDQIYNDFIKHFLTNPLVNYKNLKLNCKIR